MREPELGHPTQAGRISPPLMAITDGLKAADKRAQDMAADVGPMSVSYDG